VICLLMVGSAIDLGYESEHFDAVMQLWYPGARGGANVAKVLFGEVSPSGKLPVTFYNDLDNMPDFTDYSMKGRTYRYMEEKAQYPFGFGLTYSDVAVTDAEITSMSGDVSSDGGMKPAFCVKATVENLGNTDTSDVVQVYIRNNESAYEVRNTSLCGFQRVFVKAGERIEVSIPVSQRALTVVTDDGERVIDGSNYTVYVATFQPDERSEELCGRKAMKLSVDIPG